MATIIKFEDLLSWQKARELTKQIYEITKQKPFCFDKGLVSQIQRASVSVMANQAEGFSRGTRTELINYFYIAKGSAGEVQSHLYASLDAGYIDISTFRELYGLADEAQRLIQSFVFKVKDGGRKGIQYKDVGMVKVKARQDLLDEIARRRSAGEDVAELQKKFLEIEFGI